MWPDPQPSSGHVALRAVSDCDIVMAQELSTDPYVPQTGSLPFNASESQARDWVRRQQNRYADGSGFSFTIAASESGEPVGHCGLWLRDLAHGNPQTLPVPLFRDCARPRLERQSQQSEGVPSRRRTTAPTCDHLMEVMS
ncbi:hypothetical protein KACC15558_21350 [Brevibacterium ammoniilyticum]|uniref:N-acetyltransferase domain-containing protein n=1 Tax=Brevibacterium ammoniilyticum TaxID=1046555 RepID=A0ABP9U0E1_9MICO